MQLARRRVAFARALAFVASAGRRERTLSGSDTIVREKKLLRIEFCHPHKAGALSAFLKASTVAHRQDETRPPALPFSFVLCRAFVASKVE